MAAVTRLADDHRIAELARMMGADTEKGRASVVEMLAEVEAHKSPQS